MYRWRALLPGWLILISGSWVADGIKGEILFADWTWGRTFADHRWLGLTLAAACFVLASLWLYSYRRDFTPVRCLSQVVCTPHRSLVILVSTPNQKLEEKDDGSLHLPRQDGSEIRFTTIADDHPAGSLRACLSEADGGRQDGDGQDHRPDRLRRPRCLPAFRHERVQG